MDRCKGKDTCGKTGCMLIFISNLLKVISQSNCVVTVQYIDQGTIVGMYTTCTKLNLKECYTLYKIKLPPHNSQFTLVNKIGRAHV